MTATTSTTGGISVPVAIVLGLISSFIQSLGLTIQRKSHLQNATLPDVKQRSEWKRPLWLIGFAIFIVANIGGTVFQIGALPIVMLAPLGAVSLLYNALLARFILDDFFSRYMVFGTALIAIGAVLIGYFGVVQEPTHSLDDLLALYARPPFIAFASVFALAFVGIVGLVSIPYSDNVIQAADPGYLLNTF
jgi:drug/metabolite transporter (DMT)-like permease